MHRYVYKAPLTPSVSKPSWSLGSTFYGGFISTPISIWKKKPKYACVYVSMNKAPRGFTSAPSACMFSKPLKSLRAFMKHLPYMKGKDWMGMCVQSPYGICKPSSVRGASYIHTTKIHICQSLFLFSFSCPQGISDKNNECKLIFMLMNFSHSVYILL